MKMKSISIMLIAGLLICSATFAQKLTADKVPAAVRNAFKAKFPKVTNAKWAMEDKTEYEAKFTLDSAKHSASFDKDGKWLETETEIEIAKLPQEVSGSILKNFPAYKIKEAAQLQKPGNANLYEVELVKGNETIEVQLKDTGEIVNKSVEKG